MSEIIDKAIDVFEQQIQALYTNDFEKFQSFMTPHIRSELTIEIFQKAIDLYKRTPIGRDAIDLEKSLVYNEGEVVEIPDRHVKLVLIGSGRTLCHVVEMSGEWLIDDIYWRLDDIESFEEADVEVDEEIPLNDSGENQREVKLRDDLEPNDDPAIEEVNEDIIEEAEEDSVREDKIEEEELTDE